MPGVKILYRYIAREYVFAFIAILGVCVLIMGLNLFFDKFDDIVDNNPSNADVISYILYSLPGELLELTPQMALLAVLFGIGMLSKNNEVLAMHACGVSYTRLGFPVLICALVVSLSTFGFTETWLPRLVQMRDAVDARIKQTDVDTTEKPQYQPTREWVYLVDAFNARKMRMIHPTIFYMGKDGNRVVWKMTAREGMLVETGETDDLWHFTDTFTWQMSKNGQLIGDAKAAKSRRVRLKKHLDKLLGPEKDPDQMSFGELKSHIGILRDNGEHTGKLETDLQKKIAFPISTLILTLIGYTIAVRAHVRPMVVGFSYGLAAGISYWVLDGVISNLGHKGVLAPMVAAWLPNFAFLGFALYRVRYMNQVRD